MMAAFWIAVTASHFPPLSSLFNEKLPDGNTFQGSDRASAFRALSVARATKAAELQMRNPIVAKSIEAFRARRCNREILSNRVRNAVDRVARGAGSLIPLTCLSGRPSSVARTLG